MDQPATMCLRYLGQSQWHWCVSAPSAMSQTPWRVCSYWGEVMLPLWPHRFCWHHSDVRVGPHVAMCLLWSSCSNEMLQAFGFIHGIFQYYTESITEDRHRDMCFDCFHLGGCKSRFWCSFYSFQNYIPLYSCSECILGFQCPQSFWCCNPFEIKHAFI